MVVLMYLLNCLAVSDTGIIREKAEIVSASSRVRTISYIESLLLVKLACHLVDQGHPQLGILQMPVQEHGREGLLVQDHWRHRHYSLLLDAGRVQAQDDPSLLVVWSLLSRGEGDVRGRGGQVQEDRLQEGGGQEEEEEACSKSKEIVDTLGLWLNFKSRHSTFEMWLLNLDSVLICKSVKFGKEIP
jgi:hypothetical protein